MACKSQISLCLHKDREKNKAKTDDLIWSLITINLLNRKIRLPPTHILYLKTTHSHAPEADLQTLKRQESIQK